MASKGIAGEKSPVWLGAALLGVGVASWVGAGAVAHAELEGESPVPAETAAHGAAETSVDAATAALAVQPEPAAQPAPAVAPQQAAQQAAEAVEAAGPCAPSVELQFSSGATEVADADALRTIIAAAGEFDDRKVIVEGYASATGSPARNLELSHRRASKAKSKLVAGGVAAERVSVQAFGEYRPNLDGDEQRDRRVVIKFEGMPECPAGEGDE